MRLAFVRVGVLILLLSLGLAPRPSDADTTSSTETVAPYIALVRDHLERYPLMNEEDAYKLLYQAIRGPGHYGMSYEPVLNWMRREANEVTPDSTRPLLESIGPTYSRLYLAPYLALNGPLEDLAYAQVQSGEADTNPSLLPLAWDSLRIEIKSGKMTGLNLDAFDELTALLKREKWPAIHHSKSYQETYFPHYRVLTKKQASSILMIFSNNSQGSLD